ncbi:acyl-protein synthetase [Clostridium sardiniense]|uniref:LuxE/PaaK family acyltransferase n=1 Tax=Clostridium sardiniense TaxID=29369 RepID=UPI003D3488DB
MGNDKIIDEIIFRDQFCKKQSDKEKELLEIIKPQLKHNRNNENINSLYNKLNLNIEKIDSLEEVPFIPVNMFKSFDLNTCNFNDVVRVLNSSATTTGIPSKIYIDKKTSIRQTQGLISTLNNFLGGKRRPMLVIDSEDSNKRGDSITARGAAIRGVSSFASKIVYAMDKSGDDLILNLKRIQDFVDTYGEEEVLIYGFTYIIWSKFIKELEKIGIVLNLPKSKLLHSGGWKKLINKKVDKEEFSKVLAKHLNTKENNIIDFYGMVEQVGVVFIDCECGYKHVPDFADVIIRNILTLEEVEVGKSGLIEVISILGSSYPSQGILTEDIGELVGVDNCKCGRGGKYFKFKARAEKTETRGCGDTFAERTGDI